MRWDSGGSRQRPVCLLGWDEERTADCVGGFLGDRRFADEKLVGTEGESVSQAAYMEAAWLLLQLSCREEFTASGRNS